MAININNRRPRSKSCLDPLSILILILILILIPSSTFTSVKASPNSNITWHLPLLGLPLRHSSQNLNPLRFFRHQDPTIKLSGRLPALAITVTQNNLLAAINPKNGLIVWRFLLPKTEPIIQYVTDLGNRHLALISGQKTIIVRLLDLADGRLIWSRSFPADDKPNQTDDLPGNGFDLIFTTDQHSQTSTFPDLIAAIHRSQLFRLSGNEGVIRWTWTIITHPSWNILKVLDSNSPDQINLLLAKLDSHNSYITQVQPISSTSGLALRDPAQTNQRCHRTEYPPLIITTASDTERPIDNRAVICVNHQGHISSAFLSESPTDSLPVSIFSALKHEHPVLQDVSLAREGVFIAKLSDGAAIVFQVTSDGSLKSLWNFEPTDSVTTYAGSVDRNKLPYVSKVSVVPDLELGKLEILVLTPTERAPKGMIVANTFGYDFRENGNIAMISVEILLLDNYTPLSRVMLVTELGDIQLWQGEVLHWARHEDLSLPASITLHQSKSVGRSLLSTNPRDLPSYMLRLGKVLTSELKGLNTSMDNRLDQSVFDTYIWLIGSTTGRLFAIVRGPQSEGKVLWKRNLMLPGVVGCRATLEWKNLTVEEAQNAKHSNVLVSLKQNGTETKFKLQLIDGKILNKSISKADDRVSKSIVLDGKKLLSMHDQDMGGSPVRFLGDRGALFKYLNPNLAVYLNDDFGRQTIEVIDQASKALIWAFEFTNPADSESINAALTENWLVIVSRESQSGTTRIHSIEWFMSSKADVRVDGSPANITSLSRAYLTAFDIKAIRFTKSRLGVTSRALLAISDMDQIVSISRRFLDVRRPYKKPTTQEMEEFLMMYDPVIMTDPKAVITGDRPTKDLQYVFSFPTEFESTSAVIGVGLDLIVNTISPSRRFDMLGSDFNKLQLILTSAGLLLSTLVLRPIVKNKQLKRQWYS